MRSEIKLSLIQLCMHMHKISSADTVFSDIIPTVAQLCPGPLRVNWAFKFVASEGKT
jgi:hypothetical protein